METPSMGCEEVRDLLALFAGGECRDEEAELVEAHVGLCGPCARELDLYREARAALASLADAPAPPGLGRAIWDGVRDEAFPRGTRPRSFWLDESLRYAALLMLGLGAGVLIHTMRGPSALLPDPVAVDRPLRTAVDVRPVTAPPPILRPLPLPRGEADGHFYLPRVEAFPADGAKDF